MRRRTDNDGILGCAVAMILGIIALPLIGLYLMAVGDQDKKAVGLLLTIVGIILWIVVFGKS